MSWEAWGDPPDPPDPPDGWLCEEDAEDLQRNVGDLTMLVAQLVRALRKAAPEHELPARVLGYLQRKGLCGSPLLTIAAFVLTFLAACFGDMDKM